MNLKLFQRHGRSHIARRRRDDQEFLPAALEILETPPSPVGIWLLWIICVLAISALMWAYFGRIDVVAIAQGKVQPTGRVKVIQPSEAGRAISVLVENGQHVLKGDVLIKFDSADTDADVNQIQSDMAALTAEEARRRIAIELIADREIDALPKLEPINGVPSDILRREELVLNGDLRKLDSTVEGLEAQKVQKLREKERYTAMASAVDDLILTLQQRVDLRQSLQVTGSGSKVDYIEALQALQEQKSTLATARGQILESEASIEVFSRGIEETFRTFTAENLQKIAEAERHIDEDKEKLAKAKVRQGHMTLESPVAGTVSALSITTHGQVVAAGEELMRIVPDGIGLEIEAYVANRDVSFIRPGQSAVVKIESLPFTRYGTVDATLTKIASDAIPQPDAERTEGNPAQANTRQSMFAGAQRTQNLVYPAILHLAATDVLADSEMVPLSAGMAVTVEIKTSNRRIIEYLFSPLLEVANEAMKER